MKQRNLKIIGYVVLVLLLFNLLLFALRVIGQLIFWGVIIAGAIFVFKFLPKMKEK